MIDAKVLKKISKKTGLTTERLACDYIMNLVLDALSRCEKTKDDVIFKGGCCVHKCFSFFGSSQGEENIDSYFTKGRFSSDIDLTISKKIEPEEKLMEAFEQVKAYLKEKHDVDIDGLSFQSFTNPKTGKKSIRGELRYRGPMFQYALSKKTKKGKFFDFNPPKMTMDITADEKVVIEPIVMPIYNPYSVDEKEQNLQARCYSLEGMFAEKVRSLFERCSPRDLYDLHVLYDHKELQERKLEVGRSLLAKFRIKKMPLQIDMSLLTTPLKEPPRGVIKTMFNPALKKTRKDFIREDWEHSLVRQVHQLGSFDDYWDNEKFPQILNFASQCLNLAIENEKQQVLTQKKQLTK